MATANKGQFKKGQSASPETQFQKGFNPWNKGKVGVQKSTRKGLKLKPLSEETKEKISLAVRKEKHPLWKGGKPKCLECGKQLSNYNNEYCVEHGRMIGARNGNWVADRTLLKDDHRDRGGQLHRDWSLRVKNRDDWKCKISNHDCEGKVVAHHILGWSSYPELRYELNNGITLCHAHHPLKRAKEKLMIPVFKGLLGLSIGN